MEDRRSSYARGLALRGQSILYKFFVGSRNAVPAGIREVTRDSDRTVDERHAAEARAEGNDRSATVGLVRPDRVDTGQAVYQNEQNVHVASLRSLLALRGYKLVDIHFYVKPGYGKKPRDTAVIVMLLSTEGEAIKLPRSTIEGLRALARENRWTAHLWDNGEDRPSTVNFTSRRQDRPDHMLVMRDGYLKLVSVEGNDARVIEREEDSRLAPELLSILEEAERHLAKR